MRRLLLARLDLRHLVRVLFPRRRPRLAADDALVQIFPAAHVAGLIHQFGQGTRGRAGIEIKGLDSHRDPADLRRCRPGLGAFRLADDARQDQARDQRQDDQYQQQFLGQQIAQIAKTIKQTFISRK